MFEHAAETSTRRNVPKRRKPTYARSALDQMSPLVLDSVTVFPPERAGAPRIAASHGGVYAAYLRGESRREGA